MRVLLKSLGFSTGDALRQHVIRRLHAHLAHWAGRMTRVVVRLDDANGPRGGPDKVCSIQLDLPRQEPLVVSAVSPDFYSAVDLAVRRASRAVAHAFDRHPYRRELP